MLGPVPVRATNGAPLGFRGRGGLVPDRNRGTAAALLGAPGPVLVRDGVGPPELVGARCPDVVRDGAGAPGLAVARCPEIVRDATGFPGAVRDRAGSLGVRSNVPDRDTIGP
jgi:hypothetical protein